MLDTLRLEGRNITPHPQTAQGNYVYTLNDFPKNGGKYTAYVLASSAEASFQPASPSFSSNAPFPIQFDIIHLNGDLEGVGDIGEASFTISFPGVDDVTKVDEILIRLVFENGATFACTLLVHYK